MKHKLDGIFKWWTDYVSGKNISLNDNLAEGNKAGGLTTIVEKSLGALAKAGSSSLTEVLDYAEMTTSPGFSIMNTPGYDPTSVTGLVAGGCNIVAFTTGRGSVYGCAIAPTVKIATNQELFMRMSDDMDFNAFSALQDGVQMTGENLYSYLISVASGDKTKSEALGIGSEEFVPWSLGEML
jgi:altronate hydrolase